MARADVAQRSRPRRLIVGTGTALWAGPGRLLAASTRRRRRRADPLDLVATVRAPARGEPTSFLIQGTVDGEPATARWRPASGLVCSAEVLRRALLVVALGDRFGTPDDPDRVPASLLESPTSLFLTVLRAFSRVASVDVVVKGSGRDADDASVEDADAPAAAEDAASDPADRA
jgi:hypothetical protein